MQNNVRHKILCRFLNHTHLDNLFLIIIIASTTKLLYNLSHYLDIEELSPMSDMVLSIDGLHVPSFSIPCPLQTTKLGPTRYGQEVLFVVLALSINNNN